MKLLWIMGEVPFPPDSGGKMRTFGLLQELASRHEITSAVLDPGDNTHTGIQELNKLCQRVILLPWQGRLSGTKLLLGAAKTAFSKLPFSVIKYCNNGTEESLRNLFSEPFDLIQCENIGFYRYLSAVKSIPKILNTQNIEADIWRQRTHFTYNPILRTYISSQAKKMASYERWLFSLYDCIVAVSEDDAEKMRTEYGVKNVALVPNSVDTHHYLPTDNPPTPGLIIFSGAMDYTPNDDAAQYFIRKIWPHVRRRHPAVRLIIAGRRPSCALLGLSGLYKNIEITGRVDDIRPYVLKANIVVVPLRVGGGSRLKILEAAAMGKAIVSTTVGAQGLDLEAEEQLLLADEPKEFAAQISRLLNSLSLTATIGRNARAFVSNHYSRKTCADKLEKVWRSFKN